MFNRQKICLVPKAILALILLAVVAGCVGQQAPPEAKKTAGPVFYPPPPDAPRYQFLTSFKGAEDFDKKSSGMSSFLGAQRGEANQIKKPYGVIMRNGVISLGDTTTGVFQFDLVNKKFLEFKGSKGLGKIVQPINLSLDNEGNIYVCDPARNQVLQYDRNDLFIRAFSYPTPWKPVAAKIYDGKLYVADSTRGSGGVKVFDQKSGKFLETIGMAGTDPEQKLGIAANLDFDKDGFLYVVDIHKFKVLKYDRDGHYRGGLGGPGDSPGFFGRPRGLAIDRNGRMYVVDAAFDVVQVFASTGQLLTYFGDEKGAPGALTLPAGVYLDYDSSNIALFKQYAAPGFEIEYLILVASQFNTTQVINVYAYGRMKGAEYKSDTELYQEMLEKLEREKSEAK